ncbi:MAG: phosphate acyltransferase PlsX [Candidatus Omnitrophica bacterium]|nr:phosphate acyltransferase PlsX [Candidatus Omnitrophota bacterium]
MKIIIDAMGGDYAPDAVVAGVVDAVSQFDVRIALIGIQDKVEAQLKKHSYRPDKIEILHAPEVVGMEEPAITPVRKKRQSSISLGINYLKEGKYDAFISAGNTGAVVAASTLTLGMIPGVERPAIGLCVPSLKGPSFLIDVGANTDPKPTHLIQSALMARVYAKAVLKRANPSVGLLNIGTEETKGTGLEKETYKMMAEQVPNFIGNVEFNEVYMGKSDCIICDGYAGNLVIKVSAGLMEAAGQLIKREVKKDFFAILGAMLMKSRLEHIKKLVDYSEYGGAPLLGVNGIVMISHGRSSAKAIKNAIRATMHEVELNILGAMSKL